MALLKLWPGKSFSWHLIRTCDTASFYKMWAARDLPPGSVTALQIVRNLHSEGHGLRWLIAEVAGEPPWSPALEEVSLQVSEVTPPSSVALIPGAWSHPDLQVSACCRDGCKLFHHLALLALHGWLKGSKVPPTCLYSLIQYRKGKICLFSLKWAIAEYVLGP